MLEGRLRERWKCSVTPWSPAKKGRITMPIVVDAQETRVISLGELTERLDAVLDPRSHDSMIAVADDLKAFANNRKFLADVVAQELKTLATIEPERRSDYLYTPQVIMLDMHPSKNYFIRANIWPSPQDAIMQTSGPDPFLYHKPHDHNFNFLTVGYHGPGYWSDYYEYDNDKVAGYGGEKMDLRFVERAALTQGKVMLYRSGVDVHDQLPAGELSISLNIMENTLSAAATDQYIIDLANGAVKSIVERNSKVSMLSVAAAIGNDNTIDIIEHIAKTHVRPLVRLAAIKSLSHRAASPDERIDVLMRGFQDASKLVRESARMEIQKVNDVLAATALEV
jgi:hypothetical protein